MKLPTLNRFHAVLGGISLGLAMAGMAAAQTENPPPTPTDTESKQPGTDAIITGKVKAELTNTEGVSSNQIDVTTHNGTVVLSGVLDSKDQVQKAVAAAKTVRGVHEVNSIALKSRE